MSSAQSVTTKNFEKEVLQSEIPVVVDLWAPWCGPCRAMTPLLDELAHRYEGRVKVVKVNVDEEPAIASAFQVQGIPTLAVIKGNRLIDHQVGFGGKPSVEGLFERAASA